MFSGVRGGDHLRRRHRHDHRQRRRSSSGDGIRVLNSAGATVTDNTLGSNQRGILVIGSDDVDIRGNRIGTDSGGLPQGNGTGILLDGTTGSTIGGATAADANVIAGNTETGVVISGASTGNEVAATSSGRTRAGRWTPASSDDRRADRRRRRRQRRQPVVDNTIAFNDVRRRPGRGVTTAENSVANAVTGNRFYGNGGAADRVRPVAEPTANDAGDADGGANRGQNFPVLGAATPPEATGTLDTEASRDYTIELYGGRLLRPGRTRPDAAGRRTTVTTDAAGNADFTMPVSVAEGSAVSALATSVDDLDTSQMGSCVDRRAPPPTPSPTPSPLAGSRRRRRPRRRPRRRRRPATPAAGRSPCRARRSSWRPRRAR